MDQALDASFLDRRGQSNQKLGAALNSGIWGLPAGVDSSFYLEHYNALSSNIDHAALPFQTHNDVIDLIDRVKAGRLRSFGDLRADIATANPRWLATKSDAEVHAAVEFAVSLWLMIPTRSWTDDTLSLCDHASSLFQQPAAHALAGVEELSFNARSLKAIGGITFIWTSRLSEHLRLNKKTSELYVFRHASFLGRRNDTGQSQVYPARLLRETAETMALLFPLAEPSHRRWNRRIRRQAEVDVETGLAANLSQSLAQYRYWHDRLASIQSHYDHTTPKSVRQWVHDRRNSDRTSTFWFAVAAILLALLFGLIQSVTGILAVTQS